MVNVNAFLKENLNKLIYIPGYKTAECVAPFWKFNRAHEKESYSANGAINLWTQNGLPYIWDTYARMTGNLIPGDWAIWSGSHGAYQNGGYGHVAMYLRDSKRAGYAIFASQNPGAFREMELSLSGTVGHLRQK